MAEEQTELCQNCERQIEKSSLMLHSIHCQRNFYKCQCGEVVHKNEKEEHEQEFHVPVQCKHCNQKFQKKDILEHEQNCQMKPKLCVYCEAHISYREFSEHQKMCGSRTQQCLTCKQNILLKEWQNHQNINCLPQLQQQLKAKNNVQQNPVLGQKRNLDQVEESKVSKKTVQKQEQKAPVQINKKGLQQTKNIEQKVRQEKMMEQKLTAAKNKNKPVVQAPKKKVVTRSQTKNQSANIGNAQQPQVVIQNRCRRLRIVYGLLK